MLVEKTVWATRFIEGSNPALFADWSKPFPCISWENEPPFSRLRRRVAGQRGPTHVRPLLVISPGSSSKAGEHLGQIRTDDSVLTVIESRGGDDTSDTSAVATSRLALTVTFQLKLVLGRLVRTPRRLAAVATASKDPPATDRHDVA